MPPRNDHYRHYSTVTRRLLAPLQYYHATVTATTSVLLRKDHSQYYSTLKQRSLPPLQYHHATITANTTVLSRNDR
jgi:hypothetical protein